MAKAKTTVALVACWAAGAFATSYLGSVVNSWYAGYTYGSWHYLPLGLGYGDGHVWIAYGKFFARRVPATGSVASTYTIEGPSGNDLGYANNTKYLYFASGGPYVYVRESTSGSTVQSFHVPAGAAVANGIDFDEGAPSRPIWLSDYAAWRLWNLSPSGSVVRSLRTTFSGVNGLAYDRDTAGGPYLFAGTRATPSTIYALNPASGSVLFSFQAPVYESSLSGLAWDGRYLWTAENLKNSPSCGWVFQFHGQEPNSAVAPASLGKVKALYR